MTTAGRLTAAVRNRRTANIAVLVGAQTVNLGGVLVVTALFAPADFGRFATLFAVAAMVGGASPLRLEVAATTATEADAAQLIRAAMRSNLVAAAATGFIALTCHTVWGQLDGRALAESAALAAVTYAIAAAGTYTYARVRERRYMRVSGSKLLTAAVQVAGQVAASVVMPTPAGLLAAAAVGYGAGTLLLLTTAPTTGIILPPMRDVLHRHRAFMLAGAPAGIVSAVAVNLPVAASGVALGTVAAADVALALRIGALPSALLGQALMPLLLGEITHRVRTDAALALPTFMRALRGLTAAGCVSVAAVVAAGWWLIPVVLGEQWHGVGLALLLLSPFLLGQFAVAPVSQSLNAAGRNAMQLVWDVARLAATAAVFGAAAAGVIGYRACLLWFSAVMAAAYAAHVALTRAALAGLPDASREEPAVATATAVYR